MKPFQEQTILITGATDGIGELTAHKLAETGARVLLHGRNEKKLSQVADEIKSATDNDKIETFIADFASLKEVRKLAEEVLAKHSKLEILINNAGLGFGNQRELSQDGYELRFAVNYLAPFLLTRLLLPALKNAAPSRIVNVSSIGQSPVDFEDIMLEKNYDAWGAYRQSKLALIMFTMDLAEKVKGDNITANSLHPGTFLRTKMVTDMGITPQGEAATGAEVEFYIATSPELEGVTGKYFDLKKEAKANRQAYDAETRQKLWQLSEKLTGL